MIKKENVYVCFPHGKQTEFMRAIKSSLPQTWMKLAHMLNIDRSMVYFYLNEQCKMPYSSFIKLCNVSNLKPDKFEYRTFNIISKGTAKVPYKVTPQLAEFVGAMLGDGSISLTGYQICMSMHGILDKEYIHKITKNYFINLFGKEPNIYYSKKSINIRCSINSKEIYEFLTKKIGLPSGERKNNIKNKIPLIFFDDNELLKNVIRGLFDTEGGFYQHNRTSPRLYIYNTSEPLLNSIHSALMQLDFKAIKKSRWIKICKKLDIAKFFNEIGTNNLQKQLKYQIWLKEGKVPNGIRLIEELKRL